MRLEAPALFGSRREFAYFVLIMLLIIFGRMGWKYHRYRSFISQPFFYTKATILNTYTKHKNHRDYAVLKVRDDQGRTIYTTAYRHDLHLGDRLYLELLPSASIGFWDYLGGMYCKSYIKRTMPETQSLKRRIEKAITLQHRSQDIQELYRAIFLATPLSKTLRERIAALGVSHLVALSGFHLGILWGVLYGGLLLLYRRLIQRRYPYRHALLEVGGLVMVLLGAYVYLTGYPPSLLRSYVMLFLGWMMLLMGIELVSFTFLLTVVLILLALFPSMIVSLGFWLSVAGVFYIFLILKYCKTANKWLISLLCIPIGIFVLMQPIVHGVFPLTTVWQLLSPLLSLMFIVFYPLAFVLHIAGWGGTLDGLLTSLFGLSGETTDVLMPLWAFVGYVLLSLGAMRSKMLFGLLLLLSLGYGVYLFAIH